MNWKRYLLVFVVFPASVLLSYTLAQAQANPCAPFKQQDYPPGWCYFDAYAPWIPVGDWNGVVSVRNPLTQATAGIQVVFGIVAFYPRSGTSLIGHLGMKFSYDSTAPQLGTGTFATLNPGEGRDLTLLDECPTGDINNCNQQTHADTHAAVAVWLRVAAPNPQALDAQRVLQFRDQINTWVTPDRFWRDSEIGSEWQTPLIQSPANLPQTEYNAVTVFNASGAAQSVKFDVINFYFGPGGIVKSITTLDLPSNNTCPPILPPWGSCGLLLVSRPNQQDSNGNVVQDPLACFRPATICRVPIPATATSTAPCGLPG